MKRKTTHWEYCLFSFSFSLLLLYCFHKQKIPPSSLNCNVRPSWRDSLSASCLCVLWHLSNPKLGQHLMWTRQRPEHTYSSALREIYAVSSQDSKSLYLHRRSPTHNLTFTWIPNRSGSQMVAKAVEHSENVWEIKKSIWQPGIDPCGNHPEGKEWYKYSSSLEAFTTCFILPLLVC